MLRIAIPATCLLALVGCIGQSGSASNDTPEGAVESMVTALENNDVQALFKTIAPAQQEQARSEWEASKGEEMSEEEIAEFNMTLDMVRAEGAEANLLAMAKPQLQQAQQGISMAAGMLPMMAAQALEDEELTPEERQETQELLQAAGQWLAGVDVTDEAKLEQAIGVVCATARDLSFANHAELQAMDFDAMLGEAGKAMGGVKQVLAIYDLDLDAALASVTVGEAVIEGDTAKVPYTMTIMGEPKDGVAVVKQIDGKWYAEPETEDAGGDAGGP